MKVIGAILFIVGAAFLLCSLGGAIALLAMGEKLGGAVIGAAAGGTVIGVICLQYGRRFWTDDFSNEVN